MQEPPKEPTAAGPEGPGVPEKPTGPPVRVRGRKRRFAKRWSRRFSLLAIALFAALFITFFTVDIGRIHLFGWDIRRAAEMGATSFLKRPMHIGQVLAHVTPGEFEFRDVVIEGPTKDDRNFFQAKRIIVNVPWWTLFRRDVYLDIHIYDWRMVVERFLDGQTHLPNLAPKGGSNPNAQPMAYKSVAVYCNEGEFIYDDHVTPWSIRGPNLQFSIVRELGTYWGTAKFSKGLVKIQNFEPMHADFSTRFQLVGGKVDLKHIDLLTDGAESHISGYVDFPNWPSQEYRIQSTVDFNRMRELFFAKSDFRLSGQGRFNGIFKIPKNNPNEGFNLSGLFKSDEAGLGVKNSEWRFNNLDGELEWTPNHFLVKRADSDFLGGRMTMTYGMDPLGKPDGATASLTADYTGVDVYLFTRQFGFTALEPQGRMRGRAALQWHNGQFTETMQGLGNSVITAPAGQPIAAFELPADAPPVRHDGQFVKFQPFGEFPIGGNTAYRFTWTTLDFDESWVATPSTYVKFSGHARGGDIHVPFHVTSRDWQNSDRLFSAIMTNFSHPVGAIEVGGRGTFDGTMTKAFNAPRIEGKFAGDRMWAWGQTWGLATGDVAIENSYLDIPNARIAYGESGTITTSGRFSLGYPRTDGGAEINATIHALGIPVEAFKKAFGLIDWPLDGTLVAADLNLRGQYEKPGGSGRMRVEQGLAWGEPFDFATSDLTFGGDGSVTLDRVVVGKGEGSVTGSASLSWVTDTFTVTAISDGLPVQEIAAFRIEKAPLTGKMTFNAHGYGSFDHPTWEIGSLRVPDLYAGDEGLGDFHANLTLVDRLLTLQNLTIGSVTSRLYLKECHGTINLIDQYDAALRCEFEQTSLDPYLKFVGSDLPFSRIVVTGTAAVTGPLMDAKRLSANVSVSTAELTLFDYTLANDQPIDLSFHDNTFFLDRVNFQGEGTRLHLAGNVNATERAVDISASGSANLAVLHVFYPNLNSEGTADLQASFAGTFERPELTGRADIREGRIRPAGAPSLSSINGPITVSGGLISVDGLHAVLGEGRVSFAGGIILDGYRPSRLDLRATGYSMLMHYPAGLQSTVDANLRFDGPVSGPTLHGDVTVLRANYALRDRPERGYFSLFGGLGSDENPSPGAVSADVPSRSPIALDITIRTVGTMPLVDSQSINALIFGSGLITVTGTFDKPAIAGRVDIDRGSWMLNGNKITLLPGSIDFSNPEKLDPFFDLTAESRIYASGQTYRVTVRLTGTMEKFTPSVSSEPWLSQIQIVNLLMGDTSDVGAAELRNLSAPQEEQAKALTAVGATILMSPVTASLGSAIQRATTLSANVVPLLGTESTLQSLNPTARIVLGRSISDRVYLTYSRTLSGTQNELILVEYEQSDKVSWVLSRNEDKTFALDFRIRYVVK